MRATAAPASTDDGGPHATSLGPMAATATDPQNNTSEASSTSAVTALACDPRPKVRVVTANQGDGRLRVTNTAGENPATPGNRLTAIQFSPGVNALMDVGRTDKRARSRSHCQTVLPKRRSSRGERCQDSRSTCRCRRLTIAAPGRRSLARERQGSSGAKWELGGRLPRHRLALCSGESEGQMVGKRGLEPLRPSGHMILSHARLPIPTLPQTTPCPGVTQ